MLTATAAIANSAKPHAIVIGSGFGGLAAAVRLGAKGYRVTVLERLDAPGGRAYVHRQDGFTFDAGPTVITAPQLFEELWQLCGRRLADDVELRPVAPYYRVRFDDGSHFDYSGDAAAMRAQVQQLAPEDLAGYERFLALSREIYRVGFEQLADQPFDKFSDMLRVLPDLLRLQGWRTVWGLACRHVKSDKLRVLLTFQSLLVGGNPFQTTAVYCLIAHLERAHGVHFAMGGTGALVQGLVRLIEGQGGQLRCNSTVEEILCERRWVRGVRLASGERLLADLVVSNADPAWTYGRLLPQIRRKRWNDARLARSRYSMSLFVWYFGTRRQYPEVAHHSILLGPRYRELLAEIFAQRALAADFSLYLHRPTATDPSLAPPGCDAFYVLAPVPHLDAPVDWQIQAEPYRQAIEKRLAETVLPGLAEAVISSRLMTPLDFRERLLSEKGAAFAFEPRLTQSAWFRPHNRSEEVEGLFLVGAGTHPGAGLPGVLSSAKLLDRLIPDARPQAAPGAPMSVPPTARLEPRLARHWVADVAACRAQLLHNSKTFHAASRLLPRRVREPATVLYAFCRGADDAVDEEGGELEAVARLQARLDRVYAGQPLALPVDRALAGVVAAYAVPKALPEFLLDGLRWDVQGREYDTLDDLLAYAARVAGAVGAMMSLLMETRAPAALARACDLGVAMQLSNIARDVGADAALGRLYLPKQWLREAGLDIATWRANPRPDEKVNAVVLRLLAEADRLYARASAGVASLPLACRPGINAAQHLYAAIGHEVRRAGGDGVSRRARVPGWRKASLLLAHSLALWPASRLLHAPALPANQPLLDAVAAQPGGAGVGNTEFVLDLFNRLGRA